jgi:hypothetical protein
MKPKLKFSGMLKNQGYTEKAVALLWKWYDFSEKKGVASY